MTPRLTLFINLVLRKNYMPSSLVHGAFSNERKESLAHDGHATDSFKKYYKKNINMIVLFYSLYSLFWTPHLKSIVGRIKVSNNDNTFIIKIPTIKSYSRTRTYRCKLFFSFFRLWLTISFLYDCKLERMMMIMMMMIIPKVSQSPVGYCPEKLS